jgi:putative flippase GtrA
VGIEHGGWGRFLRYAVSSAAATLCSGATFALAYRLLHLGPQMASVSAFAAGALVNFAGNRFWAWARRHRRGLGRDVAAYAALAVGTALAAAGVTSLADWYTDRLGVSDNGRAALVEAAYFATYAAMFLVKFALLDRVLFASRAAARSRHQVDSTTRV